MKCVILASVRNERLAGINEPPAFVPLLGLPLIERILLTAMEAGMKDFIIVTANEDQRVRKFLDQYATSHAIKIQHVINEETDQGKGHATLLLKDHIKSNFVLLTTQYLFDAESLRGLVKQKIKKDQLMVSVDSDTVNTKTDLMSVMRVHSEENTVRAMNLGLAEFNGFDTGVYLCSPGLFDALTECEQRHQGAVKLIEGIQRMVKADKVLSYDIQHRFWSHIDTVEAIQRTEENLLKSVNRSVEDGPLQKYFLRVLSKPLTRLLMNTPLNLNPISGLGFFFSVLAAIFISFDHYAGLFVGAILALIAILLHVAHEEIGVLKHQQSKHSTWFDDVAGMYGEVILLIGLTLHSMHHDHFGINPLLVGMLAVVGVLMFHYSSDQYNKIVGKRQMEKQEMTIKRDLLFVLVALGAVLNIPFFALLMMTVIFNAAVIRRMVAWRQ